jgi:O-antigen biosynthesis protein
MNQIDRHQFSPQFKDAIANLFSAKTERIALLVSSEYEGYYKNGGIGTYYNALSQRLAAEGWHVILLLCSNEDRFQGKSKIPALKQVFSISEVEQIIDLQPIHQAILAEARSDYYDYQSFCVLFFTQALLASCPVATIYAEFPEMMGFGYRTIQAKQVGLIDRCVTSVTLHSGHEWIDEANEKFTVPRPQQFWQVCHYEQNSFENADLSFHPSNFIRAKVESYGWDTTTAIRLPYFVPAIDTSIDISRVTSLLDDKLKNGKIPLIFFARLEERKGLCTFIQAFKNLDRAIADRFHLIFLGKIIPLQSYEWRHLDSKQYIDRELQGNSEYDIFDNLFSAEALALISSLKHAIVCLTSPQDNFPNSALEVGQLPVQIIAADTGGFRETLGLLERTDGLYWFQAGDVDSLVDKLVKVSTDYQRVPTVPTADFLVRLNQSLLEQRTAYIDRSATRSIASKSPLVTISVLCTDVDNRDLLACLAKLHQQTYTQYRIVVVYEGAETPAIQQLFSTARSQFPEVQLIRIAHAGDTTNIQSWLSSIQQTEWALFWRDRDLASVDMLEMLVNSAITAETAVALSPPLINSHQPQVQNLRVGFVTQLLISNPNDVNLLIHTNLLDRIDRSLGFAIDDLSNYLLAIIITTGEKIAYFPYPLYSTKEMPTIVNQDLKLRKSYRMRQYIASIAPSAWNIRQIYMLKTGIQQFVFKSGGIDGDHLGAERGFKNLAGYSVVTLLRASAWKIAKKSYSKISKYENIRMVSLVKRQLVRFFAEGNI